MDRELELLNNPVLAVELVKKGEITEEEAESHMTGAMLCEFRARLCNKNLAEWDCLDCKKHGFETCDIECSVPCEECIRFELCKQEGLITQCLKCGEWYPVCAGHECE